MVAPQPHLTLAAMLAITLFAQGCSKSTTCYGQSDAEAVRVAERAFRHMVERSRPEDIRGYGNLAPTHIQRDALPRGEDGAVRVLFSNPRETNVAATYAEMFEDCDLQWRVEANVRDGVNGGSPWVPLSIAPNRDAS